MKWLLRILGNGSCEFQEFSGSRDWLRLLWNLLDTRDYRDRKVLCAPRSRGVTMRKKQAVVDNFSGTWNCRRAPKRTWVKFPCFILRHMLTLRTVWVQLFCFHQETKVLLIEIGWDFLWEERMCKLLIEVNDKCEFCYYVNVTSRIVISPSFSIICCRNK